MRHALEDEARTAGAWMGDAHVDEADDLLAAASSTDSSATVPQAVAGVAGRGDANPADRAAHGRGGKTDERADGALDAANSVASRSPPSSVVRAADVPGLGHPRGHPRQAGRMANARPNQAPGDADGEPAEAPGGNVEPHGETVAGGDNGSNDEAGKAMPSLVQPSDQHSYDAVDLLLLIVVLLVLGVAARFARAVQHHLRWLLFGKTRRV